MADEYDALEAAASSFKASAGIVDKEDDRRSSSRHHSSRDDGRSSREHRSSREDRDGRDREGRDDRDRERHRSERDRGDRERERGDRGDRDRERDRGDRERERGGGDRDRDRERDRRDYDSRGTRRPRDEFEHPPRDDRRGRYDEPAYGGPPPRRRSPGMGMVARSMRDDMPDYGRPPPRDYPPRDDYRGGGGMRGGGGRRDDRMDDRRGGGRGRDRDGGFGNDDRHRSPTPPGAVPISERRRIRASKWDEKLPEFEHLSAMQAKMTGQFPAPGPNRQPIPASGAFSGFPGAPGLASMVGFGMPVRQSKRLYIGNITPDVSEQGLAEMFNSKMREHGFAVDLPGDPVANIQVNHEKSYAFVEFRIPEEATSALAFDGVVVAGVALKIRRPKDYMGPEGPLGTLYVPGVIGTTVADTPNKVYIGGLPTYLQDEQVIELLKSFGELKSFNLVKEGGGQTGVSKGFAFCEYVDESVTDMAIQGLNNFQLADRTLVVQRAQTGRGQNTSIAYGTGANGGMMGQPRTLAQLAPNILASAAAADAQSAPTSRCMLLLNMVTPDDLIDDQDYQEILEDITEECSKYGEVEGVRVPRPTKRDAKWMPGATAAAAKQAAQKADEEAGVGRVFVLFKDLEGVGKALKGIAGRQFGGRTILCASVAEDEFLGPAPPPPPPAEPPSVDDEAARAIADITG